MYDTIVRVTSRKGRLNKCLSDAATLSERRVGFTQCKFVDIQLTSETWLVKFLAQFPKQSR